MAKRVLKPRTRVVLPKVFIGSSAESIEVAEVARKLIAPYAMALTWRDSPEFEPSQSTLAGLLNAIDSYDFALFVLSLDDRLKLRGKQTVCIRDNVLFEFGLFLGHLGAERVAGIMQSPSSDEEVRVPSDIEGITISRFDARKDRGLLIGSVASALDGFLTRVKTGGRRRKNIALIRAGGFDPPSRAFSVRISSVALQENWKKCENCSLVLVARVRSDDVPYEDDIRISTGLARRLSQTDRSDFDLKVTLSKELAFESGDVVDVYLLLVPPDATPVNAATIAAMVASGCDVIDSAGETVSATPTKRTDLKPSAGRTTNTTLHTWRPAPKRAAARKTSQKKRK